MCTAIALTKDCGWPYARGLKKKKEKGSGMLSRICQDLTSGLRQTMPSAQSRFSSIWNPLCAKSGSRHKKDIDSLDGVQRQALAMIKGSGPWHLSGGSKNWIFTAGLNTGLRGLVTSGPELPSTWPVPQRPGESHSWYSGELGEREGLTVGSSGLS